jgi:haloalkane dehalogenase
VRTAEAAGLAYREAGPTGGPVALLVHGYPQSSHMWRHLVPALADAGWRAIAPDLPGYGDSPSDPPGTWERHVEAVERFRTALELEQLAPVLHDWGGLIGLRWACDHPQAVTALVISDTGFFPEAKWHGLGEALRTPGRGEELIHDMSRDGFAASLRSAGDGFDDEAVDEYWKAFADEPRRRGQLELYRSGDFEKLEPYEGRLAALGVPALLLWGADDPFAPVVAAHRFQRELPDAELVVVEGTGHFVFDDAPKKTAETVVSFLRGVGGREGRARG